LKKTEDRKSRDAVPLTLIIGVKQRVYKNSMMQTTNNNWEYYLCIYRQIFICRKLFFKDCNRFIILYVIRITTIVTLRSRINFARLRVFEINVAQAVSADGKTSA
jgi:hypothetical protein